MKKIIGAVFFIIILSLGNMYSQDSLLMHKVKFRIANRDLSNALVDLSKVSKINIVFNIIDVPEKRVNLYAPGYTLKEIIEYLLKGTDLKYTVVNKQVVVYVPKKEKDIEYILNGYTTDEQSGEKLVYTTVYLPVTNTGTVSNDYGFYSLNISKTDTIVVFSYLGYRSKTVKLSNFNIGRLDAQLVKEPSTVLREIIITDNKSYNKRLDFFEPEKINIASLEKMVHIAGEDDIMRYNYVKAGVLTGADGFGGMHVRGGNSGGNMILLDGVPVYNAQHAVGLFSVFNSSIIKNARFLKGDFPARYGGSLESVLDIRTRDGNKKKLGGEFDLGVFTIKGVLEGPITDGKSSMLVSFRRTYLDIWSKAFSNVLSNEVRTKDFSYYFYDLNMKMNFEINNKNRIHFNFYKGKDDFLNNSLEYKSKDKELEIINNKDKWEWGNTLISLQWNSQIGKKAFVNTSLFYSGYNLNSNTSHVSILPNESDKYFYSGRILESEINDLGIKIDFDYAANTSNYCKFGIQSLKHNINPFVYVNTKIIPKISDIPKIEDIKSSIIGYENNSLEHRIYFEDKINIRNSSVLNIGLHYALFDTQDKLYQSFEPRIIFRTILNRKIVFSTSIARMSQFMHLLTNNGLGLPSEILLPSSKRLHPESIWHFGAGMIFNIRANLNFSIKTYYKYATNVVEQKNGSNFIVSKNSNWEDYIPGGKGKMYGIETELNYSLPKFKLMLNYTYSKSKRSYRHILNGKYLDYRFSRTHYINLLAFFKMTDKMIFSFSSVFGSGNPYTLPTQLTPEGEMLYEVSNNYKLPFYHRIDIGVVSKFKVKGINQELKLGIYNLLSRRNPFYVTFKGNEGKLLKADFKEVYVFPIFPSIKYKVNF